MRRAGSGSKRSRARGLPEAAKSSSDRASTRSARRVRAAIRIHPSAITTRAGFRRAMSEADAVVVQLPDDEGPTKWYNIQADLPEPLPPPKDPATGPSRIKALPELLIGECLRQENSTQRWIEIPSEIQ